MDAAAKEFSEAYDAGMIPMEFVNSMRKKGQLIMGIGHRVKSVYAYAFNIVLTFFCHLIILCDWSWLIYMSQLFDCAVACHNT